MDWLMTLAMLSFSAGSGLWLFSLLAQRRKWEADQAERNVMAARAAAEEARRTKRPQAIRPGVYMPSGVELDQRAEAMCGRRTYDDRGVQRPGGDLDHAADLALVQAALNRPAASVLHDGPHVDLGGHYSGANGAWDDKHNVVATPTETQ